MRPLIRPSASHRLSLPKPHMATMTFLVAMIAIAAGAPTKRALGHQCAAPSSLPSRPFIFLFTALNARPLTMRAIVCDAQGRLQPVAD